MLPPLVLRPPHGPRLVRLLVVILAAMFHVATAGWSLVANGAEGELAATARELLSSGGGFASNPTTLVAGPLALWLVRMSLALFGVNDFAVRLPTALGAVAMIWFTLRLAERYGTVWSGFVAALLLLCSPGMFTLGRTLTPAPLTAAFVAACLYCLQCACERRPRRRRWMLLAWVAWGFATLAGGWMAAAVPAGTVLLLAVFYGEARLRFRALLSLEGVFVLVLTMATMTAAGFPLFGGAAASPELTKPVWQFVCWQAGLLFPWSLLLLPAAGALLLRLAPRQPPLEWSEAFPLAWLTAGLALALADPARTLFSSLLFWPAFAVWGAARLETLHRRTFLRWSGVTVIVACGGLFLTGRLGQFLPLLFPAKAQAFQAIPSYFWPAVTPVAIIAMLAFVLFVAASFWTELLQNRRFALLALFAAMIPAGFAFADIGAKFALYFSDGNLARCIDANREMHPVVFVDASRFDASSLRYYLGEDYRKRIHHAAQPSELQLRWKHPAYLVTTRERGPCWKQILGDRVTLACESGEHLLLATRPENGP